MGGFSKSWVWVGLGPRNNNPWGSQSESMTWKRRSSASCWGRDSDIAPPAVSVFECRMGDQLIVQ